MRIRRIKTVILRAIIPGLVIFFLAGCWNTGELMEEMPVISLEDAQEVQATIIIYQGDLTISGKNQSPLLISSFSYNLTRWAPQVTYSVENGEGSLKIVQKENEKGLFNPLINDWSLVFNQAVPLDLDMVMGSGEYHLDLSNIHLINLKAALGTGETFIDLTGDYPDSVSAYLAGGIGHTTISLPEDIGIRLLIQGGLNRIQCDGFSRIGNFYYNSAYDFAERKIYITLFSGLGMIDINLISST